MIKSHCLKASPMVTYVVLKQLFPNLKKKNPKPFSSLTLSKITTEAKRENTQVYDGKRETYQHAQQHTKPTYGKKRVLYIK